MLAILIEMVYLYAWASGATAKFVGMPRKLKFYQKKSAERLKKLRKLIVDNYVMRNADSSPSRRRFLSLYRILYLWIHIQSYYMNTNGWDSPSVLQHKYLLLQVAGILPHKYLI